MRRSEAARYARWSATVALLLATVTLGVYVQHRWSAHVAERSAPPPAASNVKQELSHGLTFSKQEGNRKIFTVEASRSTDFRDKDSTLLERVTITIFGKAGDRHDILRTESCQYGRSSGTVECSGDVQMELQSASDVLRVATLPGSGEPQIVHVETRAVEFDRGSGIATTEQPVHFAFPNGTGQAVGLRYNSDEGTLVLLEGVRFQLHQTEMQTGRSSGRVPVRGQVQVVGSSLDFHRDTREMLLHGPTEASSEGSRLTAGEMQLVLDGQFRAQKLIARNADTGRPTLLLKAARTESEITAREMTLWFTAAGSVAEFEAEEEVRGKREGPDGSSDLSAAHAALEFYPETTEPRELNLSGGVVLNTSTGTGLRHLASEKVRMRFRGGDSQRATLESAETLAAGTLEWSEAVAGKPAASTKLRGDRLVLECDAIGKPAALKATGHVQTERSAPGSAVETASGQSGTVAMARDGGWAQMDLDGQVKLNQGERNASAQHAVFRRLEQTALLTGNVTVQDASTQTTAPRITFHQDSGEISADGGVHSVDLGLRGSPAEGAMPLNISSARMQANSKSGQAVYSVQARLWQGPSVLEADTIELRRSDRVLIATSKVRAVFPEQPGQGPGTSGRNPVLWHVTAQKLTYWDGENRAHLEREVTAETATQKIRSQLLDLYFVRAGAKGAGAKGAGSAGPSAIGAQQISRAEAGGGVTVEQGTRKAQAERGEYTAGDGRFVMSGGNPTIFDGSEGATTGEKLTFFLADDTIIVDSPAGTRTVTKHRVER